MSERDTARAVDTPAGPPDPDASLYDRLRLALASGDGRLARLTAAGTSVTFVVGDGGYGSATLLLDRNPPVAVDGQEPAEVTIFLNRAQAVGFAAGQLSLPTEMAASTVAFRGPARKYLTVHPVLSGLLRDLDRGRLAR